MRITKRQLRRIIREEKAKLQEQASGVSPAMNSLLQDLERNLEMEMNSRLQREDMMWWQNDDVILAVADMLDNLKATMAAYGRVDESLNEADKTNDPDVQELIKKAEFEKSRGRLFQGDIDAIKDMARSGYSAREIKRVKRLRF